ncbi:MAG: hypothetical protein FJX11_22165 [Alphaproteobacteria bacterium]|nr:hypothetical protein [Alphaproteobacteria bacterium]
MSHSVPSDSSNSDPAFIVGSELVEFDRRDLPIYLSRDASWMDACYDEAPSGAPLDRVFGEPGEIHVDGIVPGGGELQAVIAPLADDPLVSLATLSDSVGAQNLAPATAPELATQFDLGTDAAIVQPADHADLSGLDTTFDFQV